MKELKDYILIAPDIVPLELCDSVLAEYANCNDWIAAITAVGKSDAERQCSTIGISFGNILEKNKDIRQKIDQELFKCAANAINTYGALFTNCIIQEDSGYDLL